MRIVKAEVLRYLGYSGQTIGSELTELIQHCMDKCRALAKELYIYKIFPVARQTDGSLALVGSNIVLKGENASRYLTDADQCAVLAATLGVAIDNEIRVQQQMELSTSLILDACATAAIESVCDDAQAEIAQLAQNQGRNLGFRFSPGYGDLSLTNQGDILTAVNAQKAIGLTVSPSDILLPRKSVTALLGLFTGPPPPNPWDTCSTCNMQENCVYRKAGHFCGKD